MKQKKENKFEPITLVAGIILLIIYQISVAPVKNFFYIAASFLVSSVALAIIPFIISLICKRSKKVFSVLFFILSIFWCLVQYSANRAIQELKQKEEQKTISQIRYVVDTVEPNEALERISHINNKIAKDFFEFVVVYMTEQFPVYLEKSGLEGIITQENATWLNSTEGIKKLYKRGEIILQKIKLVDINKDIDEFVSNFIGEFEKKCLRDYPTEEKLCTTAIAGAKSKLTSENSKILKSVLKKKKELIEYEFLAIECMYKNGRNRCSSLIDTYITKEKDLKKLSENLQSVMKQNTLNTLDKKDY